MKRRNLTRGASILFALTLITTSIIGGTFAKYTTSNETTAKARVAKFGIEITADNGSLFSKTYIKATEKNGSSYAGNGTDDLVIESKTDEVAAPGAASKDGITFTVKGKPEVAVRLSLSAEKTEATDDASVVDDIHLGEYYPITYTLYEVTTENKLNPVLTGTYNDFADPDNSSDSAILFKDFEVNHDFNGTDNSGTKYTLKFSWPFESVDKDGNSNDEKDTKLGNIAAGTVRASDEDNINANIKLSLTVTQINGAEDLDDTEETPAVNP